jgi:tetratricopeptide (TPR) repeat protein
MITRLIGVGRPASWLAGIVTCLLGAQAATAAAPLAPLEDPSSCDLSFPSDHEPRDYRLRDTPELRWAVQDVNRNHYDPAMTEMREGNYSRNALADLSYTLNWWPNHHAALQALITYEIGGGRRHEFLSTLCFIERAKAMYPDDMNVRLIEAYYFYKRKDRPRAISIYEDVLAKDPGSADAHYNLGLMYFEMSKFEKAREHAQIAYSQGYPLAGLRKKLVKAGYALAQTPPPDPERAPGAQ